MISNSKLATDNTSEDLTIKPSPVKRTRNYNRSQYDVRKWVPTPEPYIPYLYDDQSFINYFENGPANRQFSLSLMKYLQNYTGLNYDGRLYSRFTTLLTRRHNLQSQAVSVIRDMGEYIEKTSFFNFPDQSSHIPDFLLTGNITRDQMKLDRILYNDRYFAIKNEKVPIMNSTQLNRIDPYLRNENDVIIAEYVNSRLVSVDDEKPFNMSDFFDVSAISINKHTDVAKNEIMENIKTIMNNQDVLSVRKNIRGDQTIFSFENQKNNETSINTTSKAGKPSLPFQTIEELEDLERAAFLRALKESCSHIKPRQEYFIQYSNSSKFTPYTPPKSRLELLREKGRKLETLYRKYHPDAVERTTSSGSNVLYESPSQEETDPIMQSETTSSDKVNITNSLTEENLNEQNTTNLNISSIELPKAVDDKDNNTNILPEQSLSTEDDVIETTTVIYDLILKSSTEVQIVAVNQTVEYYTTEIPLDVRSQNADIKSGVNQEDDNKTKSDDELFKKLVTTSIIADLFTSTPKFEEILDNHFDDHQIIKKPGVPVDADESSESSEEDLIVTKLPDSQKTFVDRLSKTIDDPLNGNPSIDAESDSSEVLRAVVEAVEITSDIVKAVDNFRDDSKEKSSLFESHDQVIAPEDSLQLAEHAVENALVQDADELINYNLARIAMGASGFAVSVVVLAGIVWTIRRLGQIEQNIMLS